MTAIVWDDVGDRIFESGIDRGVLYLSDRSGHAWNGLTSISERSSFDVEPLYFDGIKFNDVVTIGEYSATLKAFTYPDQFLLVEGIEEIDKGVLAHDQKPQRFSLSYRTALSNDLDQHAYKIHLVYNLTAVPAQINFDTLATDVTPIEFEWTLTAIPNAIEGYQPTAHLVIDSRKMDSWLLQDVEDILYGNAEKDPSLPSAGGLIDYIKKWDRLIIEDHGDGTWSAISQRDDQIIMLDSTTFQINDANATFLDPDTYEISSSPANEEDIIWQP